MANGNQIALGTKQYLLVAITDIADVVDDLSTHSPKYTVKDEAGNYAYNLQAGTATDMTIYCLIDTTVDPAGAFAWTADEHCLLWVSFTVGVEVPYLGPFDFYVV